MYVYIQYIKNNVGLCFVSGLAVGLGIGALAEVAKKSLRSDEKNGKINNNRLYSKLEDTN